MVSSALPPLNASSRPTSSSRAIPIPATLPSSSRSNPRASSTAPLLASPVASEPRKKRKLDDEPPLPPKRRKQDGEAILMEELLKPSVTIKPHPPNISVPPRSLFPIMLVPREKLPLACLDLSAPYGDFAAGRHFESRIRILELEGRLGSNILIARSERSGNVYAIERENTTGLYVLCKLGSWFDLEELRQTAFAVCEQRMLQKRPSTSRRPNDFNAPVLTAQGYHEKKQKERAFQELRADLKRRPISRSGSMVETPKQDTAPMQLPTPVEEAPVKSVVEREPQHPSSTATLTSTPTRPPGEPVLEDSLNEQPTAEGIFQNILTHYSEALYHSMGSLAYFAKGPLSRARAAFHLDCDSTLDMDELITYLRSLVMTPQLLTKKYAEAVPPIVDQMKSLIDMTEYPDSTRKKRKRKMKLGKDGMYPEEDDHVRRWWKVHKPEIRDDQTSVSPDEIRHHISCLRARETQLQLIIILEVLALETMQPVGGAVESQLPGQEALPLPSTEMPPPKKAKKKQDFSLLVDILADRLCIWQTTMSDNIKSLVESQMRDSDPAKVMRSNAGQLKDFCVDIVIPFFSARLPKICDSLNRKFGGPVTVSPKPKAPRESRANPKPGSVAKRGAPRPKTTKSLEQLMEKDRRARSISRATPDIIAQLRQATAAPIPGIKREASDPKRLADIPTRRSSSASLKERPVNVFSRSSSGIGSETKANKQAMVEAELKDAISALKKPNRELAGRVAVEETERRLFGGPTHIRKPKKAVRIPVDKVQVKATPVLTGRYRDALAAEAERARLAPSNLSREPDVIPSSGLLRDKRRDLLVENTPMRKRIAATPVRGPTLGAAAAFREDFVPTSSPMQPRTNSAALFSSVAGARPRAAPALVLEAVPEDFVPTSSPIQMRKAAPAVASLLAPPVAANLFATPVKSKAREVDVAIGESPLPAIPESSQPVEPSPVEDTRSIYQKLGWDDDDDDLL